MEPYTECPRQKKRYRYPYPVRNPFEAVLPGICMLREIVGPVLQCPAGYTMQLNPTDSFDENISKRIIKPEAKSDRKKFEAGMAAGLIPERTADVTPRGETYDPHTPHGNRTLDEIHHAFDGANEYRCVGVERKLYNPQDWLDIGRRCRPGYHLVNEFMTESNFYVPEKYYICEGSPVLPPEPACPAGYKPSLNVYNSANYFGDKALSCSRSTRFKGRLWCPDTFTVQGEPALGYPYGAEIEPNTSEATYDPYVYDTVAFTRAVPARCMRWLALPSSQCDDRKCKSPIIHEVTKLVRHFAYYAEKRDPDYVRYLAFNGYRDRRWQPDGRQYPQ